MRGSSPFVHVRIAAGAVTAFALACGAAPAAPEPLAPPAFAVVPAHVGTSVSFHYDANESSARGAASVHAVVTLTRVVNDRVAVTVTPDDAAPAVAVARVQGNGELRFDLAEAPAGAPSYGQGGPSTRASRAIVPTAVVELAALVAGRASAAPGARTWSFAAFPAGATGVVGMTAKLESAKAGAVTAVADGSGDVQVPGTVPAANASAQPERRAGGFGGYGGPGGRRRGGNESGYGGTPAAPNVAPVPATVTLHVESEFHGAHVALARGNETTTPHGGASDVPASVRWTLTPL